MPDWSAAYQEHGSVVLRYLARRVPREDAEDLAQETFVRAMRATDPIRDESRIRSYLLSTAHRLLLNFRRRKKLVQPENELGPHTSLEDVAGGQADRVVSQVALRELRSALEAILNELPGDQRLAFCWGVLERRPYREICERTGWSLSKVKIDVYRARKAVMRNLRDVHDGETTHEPLRKP